MAKHLDLSAIPPSIPSTIEPDFGIVPDLSDSGVLHRRGLFGATYYLVTLQWDLLTVAQRQTLEWFFTQEAKLEPITFTLDGHDYTAELIAGPTRRYITGTLYGITVTVRGTRVDAAATPIAQMFERLVGTGAWVDPLALSTVYADTAGVTGAVIDGSVARIDAAGGVAAKFWNDTAGQRPILRADGLEFDGVDDNLAYPDDPDLRFGLTDFTIAFALRTRSITTQQRVWDKRGGGPAGFSPGWALALSNADVVLFLDTPTAGSHQHLVAQGVIAVDVNVYGTIDIDRTASTATARIGGVDFAPVPIPAGSISNALDLIVGRRHDDAMPFDGTIGRLLVIDKLLSADDKATVEAWLQG